jgi:hypothetical protein
MHDWIGIGLVVLGMGLVCAAVLKRRSRQRSLLAAGAIRPEFAAIGKIVRPMVLFAVGVLALKLSAFYFVFGGDKMLTPFDFAGLMFVLVAYCGYLVAATTTPRAAVEQSIAANVAA